jgi:7-carboxy-7-deazaguanine synthase
MYNLDTICNTLKKQGFRTHIETSGAYEVTGKWDWFCLSPKKFKEPTISACEAADELKIIIFNKSDFDFALKYQKLVPSTCRLLLQPEWDKQASVMPQIVNFIKANPQWQVSLQTHKFMQIP